MIFSEHNFSKLHKFYDMLLRILPTGFNLFRIGNFILIICYQNIMYWFHADTFSIYLIDRIKIKNICFPNDIRFHLIAIFYSYNVTNK